MVLVHVRLQWNLSKVDTIVTKYFGKVALVRGMLVALVQGMLVDNAPSQSWPAEIEVYRMWSIKRAKMYYV